MESLGKEKRRNKLKELMFGALLVLLGGGVLVYFFLDNFLEKRLEKEVMKMFEKDSTGVYQFKFDKIDLRIERGEIGLIGFSMRPRKNFEDSLKAGKMKTLLFVDCDSLLLEGVKIKNLFLFEDLILSNLELDNPRIKYLVNEKGQASKKDPIQIGKNLAEILTLKSDNFSISNGNFEHYSVVKNIEHLESALEGLNLNWKNLEFDFEASHKKDALYIESGMLSIDHVEFLFDRKRKFMKIENIQFNSLSRELKSDQVEFGHRLSKLKYFATLKHRKGWERFVIKKMLCEGLELERFFKEDKLEIEKITFLQPRASLGSDVRLDLSEQEKPLLGQNLERIPFKIQVDTVLMKQGRLDFEEIQKEANGSMNIHFTNVSASFIGLTNYPREERKFKAFKARFNGGFIGAAPFGISLDMPYGRPDYRVEVGGELKGFSALKLNDIGILGANVKFERGNVEGLKFDFFADLNAGSGALQFGYDQLKINVLKKKKEGKKAQAKSGIANFLIRKNNPFGSKKFKEGKIAHKRDLRKPFVGYLVHCLLSGLEDTVK